MRITCPHCGSDRFKAGTIEPCPTGGVDVLMPCAGCNQPLNVFTEMDPEIVRELLEFFGVDVEAS